MISHGQDEYIRLLEQDTGEVCVERCVLLCRSMLGRRNSANRLDSSGARRGSAQGIRIHAALTGVVIPEDEEIHIIDWNASQGFHTLALLEALITRDLIGHVRHITLIHPDSEALARAEAAVKCLAGDCRVDTREGSLPSRSGPAPVELSYKTPLAIHVLGDCLPYPDIDITRLAQLMYAPGHRHIAICVNEHTRDSGNARLLLDALPGAETLRSLSARHYSNTSDHSPMSCQALVLRYEATHSPALPEKGIYTRGRGLPGEERTDSPSGLADWCGANSAMQDFISALMRTMSPSDRLLPLPSLPPYNADIALIRPRRGLLLATILPDSPSGDDFALKVRDAAGHLRDMRRLLAKHLPGVTGRAMVRGTVRLAIIASETVTDRLPPIHPGSDVRLIAPDVFHSENGSEAFRQILPMAANPLFSEENAERALELLFPPWHRAVAGRRIILDNGQQKAAADTSGTHWVLGSPASGKTTCLLHRAVNALALTGRPVLVIVPQATALCGMRRKMHDIFADFPAGSIHIVAFSDLARIRIDGEPSRLNRFRRYHTILIDDAHALTALEIESVRRGWLLPEGDVCCFANPMEARHVRIPMNNAVMLTGNYSPLAAHTAPLLSRLARRIDPALPEIVSGDISSPAITHINISGEGFEALCSAMLHFLSVNEIPDRDIMLTADDERLLRMMQNFLEQENELDTMTTFTPAREEERYKATTRNPRGASDLHADSLRHRFDPSRHGIKLALASHLQGVNAPCAVILHCMGTQPDYRGLYRMATRATHRLIIMSYPKPIR